MNNKVSIDRISFKKIKKADLKKLFKRKKVMIAILLIVVLLAAFNIIGSQNPPANTQASVNSVTVETETVKLADSIGGLTYKANLEPAEEATVSSNVSGQVTQVLFENGDKVDQAQVLAYLDDEDLQSQLRAARIELSKLQLDLDSAKSDYDIASQLYAEGACAKTSYEASMRAYKMVQANVELNKVQIQDISNALNDCVIKAPITGEIGGKAISVGQFLNPGSVIASVKSSVSIKAEIQLMQKDLEKVMVGQEVTLKLSKEEEGSYKGVVKTISASANSQTRVFDCLIQIDNTAGELNSGVFGYIDIPSKDKKEVLAAPMSAVTGSEGDYSVFILEGDTAHRISIKIGEIANDMAEIISGLQEGDTIITTNLNSLHDGDKVTVSGEGVSHCL